MPVYHGFPTPALDRPSFLTIGSFDGVHRGHQALIAAMVEAAHAAGCLAGVLTFDPHPMAVLRPQVPLSYLTTPDERAAFIETLGADYTIVLPFTRAVAATGAADFMRALVDSVRLAQLWAGPDFALGRGREGNVDRLMTLGVDMGYTVRVVPPFDLEGGPVRSSRVRALLADDGAAERATELLGRPYYLPGAVNSGVQRGRKLGFPTANVVPAAGRLTPAFGVYACWAWRDSAPPPENDRGLLAAVSIGVRPTFDNGAPSVEAYLLDYRGDLYGQTLGLSFVRRLRPELRFADAEALIRQMEDDVSETRHILGNPPNDAAPDAAEPAGAELGEARLGWEELRHTADWAIRVDGRTQRQVFARAASAMFTLEEAGTDQPITLARRATIEAANPAELLVAWLNRLLLDSTVNRELYTRFEIHAISETALQAVAYGYPGTPAHTEIKAVTYYDLDVAQTAEGWTATVTFDV
jgi:riboflavin kinase/FMN adenylyltransferase